VTGLGGISWRRLPGAATLSSVDAVIGTLLVALTLAVVGWFLLAGVADRPVGSHKAVVVLLLTL
jgi:hypothetical protein